MATVTQALRANIENAISILSEFGYTVNDKVKVKALGDGEYRVWCGKWDYLPSAEDAFDTDIMAEMVRKFIEWTIDAQIDGVSTVSHYSCGSYHSYSLVAGNSENEFISESLDKVQTKMINYDDWVMHTFWDCEYDSFKKSIEDIIDGTGLVVYHRKGKEFRIVPELGYIEVGIKYLDEDRDINECWYSRVEGQIPHNTEELDDKVQEIVSFIQSSKDDLELKAIDLNLQSKLESMADFLEEELDTDVVLGTALEFCSNYYQEHKDDECDWSDWDQDPFPSLTGEDFVAFLAEFDEFKHQPELALKDSMKLYKLGEKLGFETRFDFSSDESVSIEFLVNEAYSVHVTAEEFTDADSNWITLYRETVLPQVQRRIYLDNMDKIKRKVGNDLKAFAKKIWVRFEDSINAGNCRFGSEEFIKRHNISLDKLGAIRGDWLLEMEDTSFTQRIILSVASQHPEILEA